MSIGRVVTEQAQKDFCLELGLAIPERVNRITIDVLPGGIVTATAVLIVPAATAARWLGATVDTDGHE